MKLRPAHAALALVLCFAAWARFAGIDHHVRRGGPTNDERDNFVLPIQRMWSERTLDPTVYSGYPGFFNDVAFLPVGLALRHDDEVAPYVAGRSVVAAFGVLNVLLLYLVLRPRLGEAPALVGAGMLAASRGDVAAAHYITPDVLVVTAFLSSAILVSRAEERPRREIGAWVAAALGTAVKYTGLLIFPALLADLFVRGRLRERLLRAAAAAAVAFVLAAPYAVLRKSGDQGFGLGHSVRYYYGDPEQNDLLHGRGSRVLDVLGNLRLNLGVLGCVLAFVGLAARPWRAAVLPVTVVVVSITAMAAANRVFPRHVLLPSAAATILAAAGFALALEKMRRGGVVVAAGLALAVLAQPTLRAYELSRGYAQPAEIDQAAAWVESHGRPVLVATSLPRFALELPVEVRSALRLHALPARVLAHYDVVVVPASDVRPYPGLRVERTFADPGNPDAALTALVPRSPVAAVAAPPPARTSGSAFGAPRAFDGNAATAWSGGDGPGWLQAEWDAPVTVDEIVIEVGGEKRAWPQPIQLEVRSGGSWEPLDAHPLRPMRVVRQAAPFGQDWVTWKPTAIDGLRLVREGKGPWSVAEVRVLLWLADGVNPSASQEAGGQAPPHAPRPALP